MPRVKLDYVVSFSNEDSENPSSNLLAYEVSKKKWLCSAGEPSCSVVLQLTRAVQISTVHIGAYHAALVEVLVGRSETPNDQFEVLVPSSVFLSPMDSRRGSGVERVRSFSGEQLAPARAHKWDRVRVVCSQPYNKHCKYGLSFIHIFETEDARAPSPKPAPAVPGRITAVGNYSSDEDDFKPGELFAKHRSSEAGSKNTDAQIRQASSEALRNINDSATKLVKTPIAKNNTNRGNQPTDFNTSRQRDTLMYTDDDERPHAKIDSILQRHKDEKEQETKKKDAVQNLFKKNNERANILESASKNFKEFLDDNDNKRKLNSSTNKVSSKDDNSRNRDSFRESDKNNKNFNSTSKESSRNDDRRNKDNLNNSRNNNNSRDNDKRSKDNLNNSINTTNPRDNDRRNKDDGNTSQSRTKRDAGPSGDRDNRKRQHSDDRQKEKEVLVAGPVSSTPHTLLSGVVFALSGYENPRRARLRDAARAMGARFERDWNPGCTHLICAFPNTPKLRTVRSAPSGANCIAVLGEWVEQCCEKRRLLPWQWFATEHKRKVPPPAGWDDDKTASECDTDDEIEKVLRKQKRQRIDKSPSPQPTTSRVSPKPPSSRKLSPKPHTTREKSPKPHTSREKSPKPHTSRERSPKPHSSRERSPKPHSSREKSPKIHSSRERSPKPHPSRERSPKPHSSREQSPKLHSSRERSPKLHSSREKSPKPHTSKERSPKPHSSREKSPKPDFSREKQSSSKEKSRKRSRERSQSKESQKSKNLNFSNMSSDSDVAFVKDERIQANITIDSGNSTDEEKPSTKERIDKKCTLPEFFDGYTFVIEDCVEDAGFDKELLSRYVRAYGGVVMDASQVDDDSEISFVLSAGAGASSNGLRVRADWLWRCHQDKQMCDVAEYTL